MTSDPESVLDPEDAMRVVQRFQERIARYGVTFESLNSGSLEKQKIRHKIHARALITPDPSVLDIGCGLGDFYSCLKENSQDCEYTGYDIVPEYIAECRKRYPKGKFAVHNIFSEGIDGMWDTIVMSQVLNNRYKRSDNTEVMKKTISLAFSHTRISVSIDMMSTYVDYQDPNLFYYSPEEIFHFAKTVAHRVILRHDYRPFEFCIQLFHDHVGDYVP
jgi:SAM-dependent methyltransferase